MYRLWKLIDHIRFCRVRQLFFPSGKAHVLQGAALAKVHAAWSLSYIFGQIEAREVLLMEDTYWPMPDPTRRRPRLKDFAVPPN